MTNLSRYETDLKRLITNGDRLFNAIQYEQHKDEVVKQVNQVLGDKAADYLNKLPKFSTDYQQWYSEAKAVVRQLIPDRLSDFVRHYERQNNRKEMTYANYTIKDYLQDLSRGTIVQMDAGVARMQQQLNILKSAQQRFKSSLFDIKQLVAADLFDSEIEAARALAKNKFLRAAGAISGVILEKHLAQVCENHSIKIAKKNPSIGDLNDLLKNADVIDTPRWRANQHLADIRNLCDHSKDREPTSEEVGDFIDGVAKVLKQFFENTHFRSTNSLWRLVKLGPSEDAMRVMKCPLIHHSISH